MCKVWLIIIGLQNLTNCRGISLKELHKTFALLNLFFPDRSEMNGFIARKELLPDLQAGYMQR